MKKFYSIIYLLLICSLSFAQITPKHILTSKNNTEHVSSVKVPKSVAPFWSEDFSNGIPSTWTNSPVPWAYRGPSTSPNSTVGTQGAYGTNQGPIQSPTAQNGFMIFDSDYYDNLGVAGGFGTGQYPSNPNGHIGKLTTESIDLSSYPAVSLLFNSFYREYTGIAKVAFSIDVGVTFTDEMEVHPDIDVNDATTPDYQVMLNIPPNIAGQPSVHIQFIYDGTVLYNSYYGYYFWCIDDIQLIETPANLMVCQDEMFGGWWLGYQTTGDLGCNYTFNPMAQALGNPYRLEGVVRNLGANAQNNVTLHGDIADDAGNVLFSDVSNGITLGVSSTDTLALNSFYTPTGMGLHNISIWATSDSFPYTDTATMSSIVSDSIYAIDYDWNSDGANLGTSAWRIGRTCGGQVGTSAYDIYADAQVTSISFHVGSESVVGAQMTTEVYEGFGSNSIFLAESDPYSLTAADIGNWVTIPLLNPLPVFKGTSYMAAVRGFAHPTDTFLITVATNPASSSYIQDNGCNLNSANPAGTWYTATDKMAIRMNFGYINNVEDRGGNNDFKIYPNPTNGLFSIITESNKPCTISITNVIGQEIISLEHNGITSPSIDLNKFDKGIYNVTLSYENKVSVKSVILE